MSQTQPEAPITSHPRNSRKIDPARRATMADSRTSDNARVQIGPTQLAIADRTAAGLATPDLGAFLHYRRNAPVQTLQRRDNGGLLMFNPLNIRDVTDTTDTQRAMRRLCKQIRRVSRRRVLLSAPRSHQPQGAAYPAVGYASAHHSATHHRVPRIAPRGALQRTTRTTTAGCRRRVRARRISAHLSRIR